jgi:rhodanese-related sulfurtransferase
MRAIRFLLPFALLALSACGRADADTTAAVDGPEAARLVAEENALVVDVRTPAEYAAGHVDGALNVPVQELPEGAAQIDRSRPVIVYCRSGRRSANAARILAQRGYQVYDLGPMSAWTGG